MDQLSCNPKELTFQRFNALLNQCIEEAGSSASVYVDSMIDFKEIKAYLEQIVCGRPGVFCVLSTASIEQPVFQFELRFDNDSRILFTMMPFRYVDYHITHYTYGTQAHRWWLGVTDIQVVADTGSIAVETKSRSEEMLHSFLDEFRRSS